MPIRSLKATEKGVEEAIRALTNKNWSRDDLAGRVVIENKAKTVSLQTIQSFFAGNRVDRKYFLGICRTLELDWETIADSTTDNLVKCDRAEYLEAIKAARQRVWVYQTWLPATEIESDGISSSKAIEIRLLLLSFKESSPVYARLQGRGMTFSEGQSFSATSVKPFVKSGKTECIRFNYTHHPGWIAVIDSLAFWGPTPVDVDSHSTESQLFFHKYPSDSDEGRFWIRQFELLWDEKHSHSFSDERQYNETLLNLDNK